MLRKRRWAADGFPRCKGDCWAGAEGSGRWCWWMAAGICGCTMAGLNSADVGEPTVWRRAEAAASKLSGERCRREEGELAVFSVIKQVRGGVLWLGGRELQRNESEWIGGLLLLQSKMQQRDDGGRTRPFFFFSFFFWIFILFPFPFPPSIFPPKPRTQQTTPPNCSNSVPKRPIEEARKQVECAQAPRIMCEGLYGLFV